MPIYDFGCADCGPFSVLRQIGDRENPCHCPSCGRESKRLICAPSLALMAGSSRVAHATNERAAHAPRQSTDGGQLRHRQSCACCSGERASLAGVSKKTSSAGLKQPSGRPWMISH
ncbi:FmdB family zinc ribbon protein [Cupriavidus sp. 2TAF22]|uniref:FmdB family zinc ribbon protein n=1 Tax=unclassified Cupriavidus TaxID=2640874 RepID=UPI003F8F3637